MTGKHTDQQVEILARMKKGWKLERVFGEFPFNWVLVPPTGKGGVYYQSSPIKSLAEQGIIRLSDDGHGGVLA